MEAHHRILKGLAAHPSAPFHEELVAEHIRSVLGELDLAPRNDPYGNIIVEYHKGQGTVPLAFVAHMDHPAFEIVSTGDGAVTAALLGGVREEYFQSRVPVRIYSDGLPQPGEVVGYTPPAQERSAWLEIRTSGRAKVGDYGVWELADFEEDGDLLHMRAADDLAGCGATLALLRELTKGDIPGWVYAVFTRAEEVGLIGATLVARQGILPKDAIVVSLESSRALPGAAIGDGPIIRVGDARRTFHPEAEAYLLIARDQLLKERPDAKVQRQLMSGGTCEATAFSAFGYKATGLAFPLGNYHNMGTDGIMAPEYIHRSDFDTGVELLIRAVHASASNPDDGVMGRLTDLSERHKGRLSPSL